MAYICGPPRKDRTVTALLSNQELASWQLRFAAHFESLDSALVSEMREIFLNKSLPTEVRFCAQFVYRMSRGRLAVGEIIGWVANLSEPVPFLETLLELRDLLPEAHVRVTEEFLDLLASRLDTPR